MLGRLTWLLPAAFLCIAVIYAITGQVQISALYGGIAMGLALHAMGVRQHLPTLQWFGAGIAGFAVMVLLWITLGQP